MPLAIRLAPFTGVYGISFVFAMIGCAVALLVLRRPRMQLAWLAVLVVVLFLPALPAASPGDHVVRVVQPNIDTETQFTTESLAQLEDHMAVLSQPADAPLIVWPEAPAPFYPSEKRFADYLAQVARDGKAYLLMGGVAHTESGGPLNSAFLVSPSGAIVDRYDKIRLVPFGEFVPRVFGWVNRITQEAGDFVPGSRIVTFPMGDHRIGSFICYESAFPELVRQFPRDGAELLVNLSNDGYFGHSDAHEQHLSLVRMRAAENRRWILRATNDGITAMIDPAGRVVERLPSYRQVSTAMQYSYVSGTTPYTRYGDWFAWGCLLISVFICVYPWLNIGHG